MHEAQHVLSALGSSLTARGGKSLLAQQPTVATWGHHALEVYRCVLWTEE